MEVINIYLKDRGIKDLLADLELPIYIIPPFLYTKVLFK